MTERRQFESAYYFPVPVDRVDDHLSLPTVCLARSVALLEQIADIPYH